MGRHSNLAFGLGRRVREARLGRRRTLQAIAHEAGTSVSTVSRMELGRGSTVPLGTWASVAAAVGVDLFTSETVRDEVYVRAVGRLIADGGWTLVGRAGGSAWFDRPARPIPRLRLVQAPAERLVVRILWVVTDIEAEFDRLRTACADIRDVSPPGLTVGGLIVVIRSTTTARCLSGTRWQQSSFGWMGALRRIDSRLPDSPGLVWAAPRATHLLMRA